MQKKNLRKEMLKNKKTHIWPTEPRKKIYIVLSWPPFVSISVSIFRCFQFPLHLYVPLWTKTHLASGWRETASRVSNCSFPSVSPLLTHSQPTAATSLLLLKTQDRMPCSFSHFDTPPRFVFIYLYSWCIPTSIWAGFLICNCLTVINSFSFSLCSAL